MRKALIICLNVLLVFTALSVFLTGCAGNKIDEELNSEYKAYALESTCNYVNQEKYTIENETQYVNEYICDCIEGCENYNISDPIIRYVYDYNKEKLIKNDYDTVYIIYAENKPLVLHIVMYTDASGYICFDYEFDADSAKFIDNQPFVYFNTQEGIFLVTKNDYILLHNMSFNDEKDIIAKYANALETLKKKVGSSIYGADKIDLSYAEKASEDIVYSIVEGNISEETIEQCKLIAVKSVLESEEFGKNNPENTYEAGEPLKEYRVIRESVNKVYINRVVEELAIPVYENGKAVVLCYINTSEMRLTSERNANGSSWWEQGLQQSENVAYCGTTIIYEDHYDTGSNGYTSPWLIKAYLEIEKSLHQR